MLDFLRTSTRSWFARGFFLLLALSFGLFGGIQDIVQDLMGNKALAQVGPQRISVEDYKNYLHWDNQQAAFTGSPRTKEQLKDPTFLKDVLVQMIRDALIQREAERIGLVIPDNHIRDIIHQSPFFEKKRYFDRPQFLRWLREQGISEKKFIDHMRRDLVCSYFLQTALPRLKFIPASYVKLYGQAFLEQRHVLCVRIEHKNQIVTQKPTENALKDFLKNHTQDFMAPEMRLGITVTLNRKAFGSENDFDACVKRVEQSLDQGATPQDLKALSANVQVEPFKISSTDAHHQDGPKKGLLPKSHKILDAILKTDSGQTSTALLLDQQTMAFVRVDTIEPERPLSFEEARPHIVVAWTASEQKKKAKAIAISLQKEPKSFHQKVAALGLAPHHDVCLRPEGVTLTQTSPKTDPHLKGRSAKVFATPLNQVALYDSEQACEACYVQKIESPTTWSSDTQTKLEKWLKAQQTEDIFNLYIDHLVRMYKVKIHPYADDFLQGLAAQIVS